MSRLPVRYIRVIEAARVTPRMARVRFGGDDLRDLTLNGPDQQVKLYFPRPGQTVPSLPEADGDLTRWYEAYTAMPEDERPWMRGYTIRAHDPRRNTVTVDFVLHGDAGPATRWALNAAPGDTLGMFGPSAEFDRPVAGSIAAADWVLLAGDETALPAIGTLIEALPAGARAIAYVEVAGAGEEQHFDTRADVTVHWLHRDAGDALADTVRAARFPEGPVFAWLAGEAGAVRAMRRHLVEERGLDRRSVDFAGYWRARLTQDDPPTEEDLADARELLAADGFEQAYETGFTPWVIGEPQPAVVGLARDGRIRGTVLDAGCGTGENAIHLAGLGYDVRGVDSSRVAIERARANAEEHGVGARFEVADALLPAPEPIYDTILDSALFHNFDDEARARYVAALASACRDGGLVHVLALSDEGPGYGPEIGESVIREAFGDGWVLEDLRASVYRGVIAEDGGTGDVPAWLARVRRTRPAIA